METKIIKAVFGAVKSIITQPRYRYDYGQIIEVSGITLPESFEARFSNVPTGTSVRVLGQNQRVAVPDALMRTGKSVWCYITVHDAVTDGRTMYTIRIPIRDATERTDAEPTPVQRDIISQAIATLNNAVERTSADVEAATQKATEASDSATASAQSATASANNAEQSAQRAVESAQSANQAAEASESATASAQSATASAQSATESAQYAVESAQSANQSAVSANQSAQSASASASSAQGYASQAQTSAQTASTKASEASASASTASTKATEASQSASQALTYKTDAETAKTASQTAQGLAESARDSAISAQESAEDARDEAQTIVDGISGKVEQIDSNTERIESLEDDIFKPYAVDSASGAIASFTDGADNIPLKSLIVNIDPVQDTSSGDPSPENICPISGWTEINAYNDPLHGGNIEWNQLVNSYRSGSTNGLTFVPDANDKSISISGTITTAFSYDTIAFTRNSPVKIKRDGRRYIIICNQATPYPIRIAGFADCVSVGSYGGVFSNYISENQEFTNMLAFHAIEGDTFAISNFTVQIFDLTTMFGTEIADYIYSLEQANVGAGVAWFKKLFPKDYYEYNAGEKTTVSAVNGKPYTHVNIQLGQTVYGGKLDVLSGVLTVDRANIASYNGETLPSTWISDRDAYAQGATPTTGAQVVYELATPITLTLSPTEIKSLLGDNNIWADAGESAVIYRADTTLYINRKIAEAISALS